MRVTNNNLRVGHKVKIITPKDCGYGLRSGVVTRIEDGGDKIFAIWDNQEYEMYWLISKQVSGEYLEIVPEEWDL